MYPQRRTYAPQQRRIRRHVSHSDPYTFFKVLTGPELLGEVEALLPTHRERLFSPTETLSMFLAQALSADRSCQKAVNDTAVKRLAGGLPRCSTRTGAYCRARQRLPVEMIATLVRHTGRWVTARAPEPWRWRGRPVRLVDGTTVVMPDTPANQAAYPQPRSQKPGLGFPLCRLVGIVCLGSGAVLNGSPELGSGLSIDLFHAGNTSSRWTKLNGQAQRSAKPGQHVDQRIRTEQVNTSTEEIADAGLGHAEYLPSRLLLEATGCDELL